MVRARSSSVPAARRAPAPRQVFGYAPGAQVPLDPGGAVLARKGVDARLGVARVRQELAPLELVEQCLQLGSVFDVRPQPARKLRAGVLAPGENPECSLAQARFAPCRAPRRPRGG